MKSFDIIAWALAGSRTKKFYKKKKFEKALESAEDAMQKSIKAFGDEHINTSRTAYNLVLLNSHFGKYEEAEKYALIELKIMEDLRGVDSYDTITELRVLEELYRKWEKIEKADELDARISRIIDEEDNKPEEDDSTDEPQEKLEAGKNEETTTDESKEDNSAETKAE